MMLMASVILFQNFAASYTSFLSVVTLYQPFDNIKTLYTDTEYLVGTRQGSAIYDMFKV